MGTLLRYLTTAEGCDLIIICEGQFFFVHKAVIAAHSPVLSRDATKSAFYGGETYILNAVCADVFHKVLTFMYTGDIPDSCRNALAASDQRPLNEKFPLTDAFLVTVQGKPATVSLSNGSLTTVDTITNANKWAKFMAKQALNKDPYDTLPCQHPDEVFAELNGVCVQKIIAWFERELHVGLSLSEDFRISAGYILRTYEDFTQPFFRLCATHLPVVEQESALTSVLEKCNPSLWEVMMSVRKQWQKELKDQRDELQKSKDQVSALKTDLDKQKNASRDLDKAYQSRMEALEKSRVLADGRTKAAQAMARQLDELTRSLQQDLLKEQANAVRLKENIQKENKLPKSEPAAPKLQKKIEDLRVLVKSKEQALEQSKAANNKIKEELRDEKEELWVESTKMKDAFTRFKRYINREGECPCCRKRYNIRIEHERYTSIGFACAYCSYRSMFRGEDD
ncbi:BTB/POZ domain-containing protein [Cladophialophora immunda]|nr:BTB/POZ domain-containing protein [Cladophialophora immunda]